MLKDRTWFTDNTEVLSINGWVDITKLSKITQVIVLDTKTGFLKGESLTQYNTANLKLSPIYHHHTKDIFISAKNIIFPNDCIWRVDDCTEVPILKKDMEYTGVIYNLVTPSNTLITRNHTHNSYNNNDYIVSLCKIVK